MPKAFEPKATNPALGQLVRLHADIGGKILEAALLVPGYRENLSAGTLKRQQV
jgi:hypothetical protein